MCFKNKRKGGGGGELDPNKTTADKQLRCGSVNICLVIYVTKLTPHYAELKKS